MQADLHGLGTGYLEEPGAGQGSRPSGQEKSRREFERMPHHGILVEGLIEPDIRLEPVHLDDFWEKRR